MHDSEMLTAFLAALEDVGQDEAGLPYLDQIRLRNMGLQSTDATFLYQHGLPFLGIFLVRSTAFIRSSKDDAHGRA